MFVIFVYLCYLCLPVFVENLLWHFQVLCSFSPEKTNYQTASVLTVKERTHQKMETIA